jgi:sulfoxide reductase heme-binding subunit YedZ
MNPQDHAWWLLSRSAGIVALILVATSTLIGLALANKLAKDPQRRRTLAATHEHTANAALAAIGLHGVTLLGDPFLNPRVKDLFIPLTIDYRPAYVATGIVAGYAAAFLGLSFYARRRIKPKRWRRLHRLTPLVYVLALTHTLGAGTDAHSAWLRAFMLATALPAAALTARRLMSTRKAGNISVSSTKI